MGNGQEDQVDKVYLLIVCKTVFKFFFFFFRELPDRWACFPSLPEVLLLKPLVKIINISSGQLNIDFFFTTYAKLFLF